MARQPRFEAAGAVYHVMARGDGGRNIFDTDEDRNSFITILSKACERSSWRVHAYVVMGNHFHLLLETPKPNLVDGMRWLMGVFALGWNRRRNRRGHVFQGRYKSVVVSSENRSDGYFRTLADYIHLNPVRIAWVGGDTGRKLASYEWSSFTAYAGCKRPKWLVTKRVTEEFGLMPGRRGERSYSRYLEARALDREGAENDESLKELRRGWCLGTEGFKKSLLAKMDKMLQKGRKVESYSGEVIALHDIEQAEGIVTMALSALALEDSSEALGALKCSCDEKVMIAGIIRRRTGVKVRWIAERLVMGHPTAVARAQQRLANEKSLARRKADLEKALNFTD